jgi:xylan 1,4-beta-xylosidase
LVASSFVMTPGLPILHSKDLVNWELIGHALNRSDQMEFDGMNTSSGIMAPTLRYHDGIFYLITTGEEQGGNFYLTATNPAGPWSRPQFLPEIKGIDPDLFFIDDGKAYIVHNGVPAGPAQYDGHRAIWLWEFDLQTGTVVKNSGRVIINGGADLSKKPFWIEAPHIYKINGWYYLMCAEGGTAYQHSEVVFRTRSLSDPFEAYPNNPILTQRDLHFDRENPITTAGHSDMVQAPDGSWWAVFLGARTYDKTFFNQGRETFLLPITWKNEWPVILDQGKSIPYHLKASATHQVKPSKNPVAGNFIWRDDFSTATVNLHWNYLRKQNPPWVNLHNGAMNLEPQPFSLSDKKSVAFVARRQQHLKYNASTSLAAPSSANYSAGLAVYQNENNHYYLGLRGSGNSYEIFVEQVKSGANQKIASQTVQLTPGSSIVFFAEGDKALISFAYEVGGKKTYLLKNQDAKMLSTTVAGGFVGTLLGMHARLE